MTIQQAAAATGLSVHTLRYYERIGLLDPVPRMGNSHRLFREEDILWIGFLLKLRTTGLPIRDMLRYAELRRLGNTPDSVSARKALLEQHTLTVEQTLTELQSNLAVLRKKILMYEDMQAGLPVNVTSTPTFEDRPNERSKPVTSKRHNSTRRNAPARR